MDAIISSVLLAALSHAPRIRTSVRTAVEWVLVYAIERKGQPGAALPRPFFAVAILQAVVSEVRLVLSSVPSRDGEFE
jgi:hypothetical protein